MPQVEVLLVFYYYVVHRAGTSTTDSLEGLSIGAFLMQYPHRFSKAAFKADFHLMIDALSDRSEDE